MEATGPRVVASTTHASDADLPDDVGRPYTPVYFTQLLLDGASVIVAVASVAYEFQRADDPDAPALQGPPGNSGRSLDSSGPGYAV